jgi:hypothetical protein
MSKGAYRRKDRLIKEKRHDAYQENEKWPEPTFCTECRAVFANGRWSWNKPTNDANKVVCPACRRVADHYPAGYIELKGDFFCRHREEISNLIHHIEEQEKAAHPLERIMTMREEGPQTVVMTTGVHLARRIGEALSRSYKGDYSFQYAEGEKNLRVSWER